VEALCSGLPVVSTPVGGLGNLVIPAFNGAIVNPDGGEIAGAIMSLSEPTKWATMRANCLSLRDAFSKETWTNSTLDWLES
jgi:glycosyltransferase involved in cell wall biosynthesis